MKRLGYLGILLVQGAYLPQTYRTYTTRQVAGLSPWFIGLVWVGLICFQVYAYHTGDRVYIISNWFGLVNTSLLLAMIATWGGLI